MSGHCESRQKAKRGNHDPAECWAYGPYSVEADGKEGNGSGNIASVHDMANRGLPGGIVESAAACDQEAEAEDHPWTDKAQRHKCGQHRRYRHKAPAGEHDPATAELSAMAPAKTHRNAGNVDEAGTRATIRSEVEIVAISWLMAIVCISQPRLETCVASQIERKVEFPSGANVAGRTYIRIYARRSAHCSDRLCSAELYHLAGLIQLPVGCVKCSPCIMVI